MNKYRLILFSIVIFGLTSFNDLPAQEFQGAQAQKLVKGAEKVILNKNYSLPTYIKFYEGNEIELVKWEGWLRNTFKVPNSIGFKTVTKENDALGFTHIRMTETFLDKPMLGADLVLHVKNNRVVSLNGKLFANINPSDGNIITEEIALQKALNFVKATTYKWQIPLEEEFIKKSTGNDQATYYPKAELFMVPLNGNFGSKEFVTAYRFDIYASKPLSRKYVFVNALTGEIVLSLDRIHNESLETNVNATGTANTKYSGTRTITTDSYNGSYRLREVGRGNGIETYNMAKGTNYGAAVDFTDADNVWNNFNAQFDEVAADAHWATEVTYDYYFNKFNRSSVDNNGFLLKSYVHYDTNYVNAFWDGTEMTYGDGNSTHTPLTTLDICGHEITHGVTEHTASLIYQAESGALNEGFSDIFGACIEFYGKPPLAGNWLLGEDIGTPFRSMSNPNQYGQPDTYNGTNWASLTGGDNGGVHTNSGVINYWFYLLSVGGTGTNDNGEAFTVTSITIDKAAAIAYRALVYYLTSASTYADARTYTLLACQELYGGCSPEAQQVTNAWHAVGVGPAWTQSIPVSNFTVCPDTYPAAPQTVQFTNTSTFANTFKWYFGDGSTSTSVNPSHIYTTNGNFDVKLVCYGGSCGNDSVTKPSFIHVDPQNTPMQQMPISGTGTTLTSCNGTIYDSGGCDNYTDSTNGVRTISPTGASSVSLHFLSFGFEDNYDYLYVYNGASTSSPQVAGSPFTGTTIPADIVSTTGSITLKQTSDQGVTASGFEAVWTCTTPTIPPVAYFSANVSTTCTGIVQFSDLSSNGPSQWLWNFGDGSTSTEQNPVHAYATNGTFTVILKATNNYGTGTDSVANLVTVNMPNPPTTTSITHCGATSVTLTASGSSTLKWYDAPIGGNLVDTGTTFVTPILNSITNYYVSSEPIQVSQYVGKLDSIGGGAFANTNQALIFDCFSPVKLVSVKVYLASALTNVTVQLRNSANTVISSVIIPSIPAGASRITLNMDIPVATNLRLGVGANTPFYRNATSSAMPYPYTITGKISIKTSTATTTPNNYYYYFYNWEVKDPACSSPRIVSTANILDNPVANIQVNDSTICIGNTALLTASSGSGFHYQWYESNNSLSGDTLNVLHVSTPGHYSVHVSNNCGTANSLLQSIVVNPLPPTPIVTNIDGALSSSSSTGNQWYSTQLPILISGATNPTYIPTTTGNYYVVVTDSNSCSSQNSNIVYVIVDGISENALSYINVFPNPNAGHFYIQMNPQVGGKIAVSLTDALGRSLFSNSYFADKLIEIRIGNIESGVYFLNLKSEKFNLTRNLIIRR